MSKIDTIKPDQQFDCLMSAITLDTAFQMRALGVEDEVVNDYVERLSSLPPVLLAKIKGDSKLYMLDGFHRFEAHRRTNSKYLPAIYKHFATREDVIIKACGMNAEHGLRRTNADKRRATEKALAVLDLSKYTLREIGDMIGVSHGTVHNVRKDLETALLQKTGEQPAGSPAPTPLTSVKAAEPTTPATTGASTIQKTEVHDRRGVKYEIVDDPKTLTAEAMVRKLLTEVDEDHEYLAELILTVIGRKGSYEIAVSHVPPKG